MRGGVMMMMMMRETVREGGGWGDERSDGVVDGERDCDSRRWLGR